MPEWKKTHLDSLALAIKSSAWRWYTSVYNPLATISHMACQGVQSLLCLEGHQPEQLPIAVMTLTIHMMEAVGKMVPRSRETLSQSKKGGCMVYLWPSVLGASQTTDRVMGKTVRCSNTWAWLKPRV